MLIKLPDFAEIPSVNSYFECVKTANESAKAPQFLLFETTHSSIFKTADSNKDNNQPQPNLYFLVSSPC